MLKLVATIAFASVLLAGCGSSEEPSDAAPRATASGSPTPERVYAVEELATALPRSSQVPTGERKIAACPGGDSCKAGTASVTIELTRPVDRAEQEALAAKEFSSDFVQVTATASTNEAAARAVLAERRDDAGRYVGTFDLPAKETSDSTYTAGEKGEGTLDDLTLGGWKGFVATREVTFADPEGRGSTYPYESSQVHLVKGTTVISCYATVMSQPRGAGAATDLARALATQYLQRLG